MGIGENRVQKGVMYRVHSKLVGKQVSFHKFIVVDDVEMYSQLPL